MTKEQFIEQLKAVGYSTKGTYPNEFIIDNLGKEKPMRVLNERVDVKIDEKIELCIYYKNISFQQIDNSLYIQSNKDDETTGFFLSIRKNTK